MGVDPVPDHVDAVGMRHQLRQHACDEGRILGLFVGLVGVNHELEAANSVGDRDRRIRADGVGADLAVRMAQRIIGDVDDQPAGRRRGAVERHAHQPPGGAAATVAADHVACRERSSCPSANSTVTPSSRFRAGLHAVSPPHLDMIEAVQAAKQFGVDHRLNEAVALGPAETGVGRRHFGEQSALGVEEPQNLVGHGVRQDVVDQADRLEGAQRLVVEPDTARDSRSACRAPPRPAC